MTLQNLYKYVNLQL